MIHLKINSKNHSRASKNTVMINFVTDCWDKLGIDKACESECCKSMCTHVNRCSANRQVEGESDASGAHKGKCCIQ